MGAAKKWVASRLGRLLIVAVAVSLCWAIADQVDATTGKRVKAANIKGVVCDSQGRPVANATVYFIENTMVDTSEITAAGVLAATTDGFDEPLEDIINNADKVKTLIKAVTNAKGQFKTKGLNGESKYFPFVVPDPATKDYLPGGDVSRAAFAPRSLGKGGLKIQLSWNTPADATYIGSTACYGCHPEQATNKAHAHSLAVRTPGSLTANQDKSVHSQNTNYLTDKFKLATAYNAPVNATDKILVLDWGDLKSGAYLVTETDHTKTAASSVHIRAYLWKKDTGEHFVTLVNTKGVGDANNPLTVKIGLVKGGLMGNSYLLAQPPNRKGCYQLIGYKGYPGASEGKTSYYDRGKHPWSLTVTNWLSKGADGTQGTADDRLTWPAALNATGGPSNWEGSCGHCHFTGFEWTIDATTTEKLANPTTDPNGIDPYGSGTTREFMIGCEVCHGKGSKHRDEALKAQASGATATTTKRTTKTPVDNFKGKYIVNPKLLCNDRSALICGRCHRACDAYKNGNDMTTNANFPPAGISRAEFLSTYVDPAKRGPAMSAYWPDGIHPNKGKNYPDWISSKHSHNQRYLVSCDDCHSGHFSNHEAPRSLLYDPHADSPLCQRCHSKDISEHALEMTGHVMTGATMECIYCHMPKTALEGAGKPGMILGTPQSSSTNQVATDGNIIYWEADVPSHTFRVPNKFSIGVAGKTPKDAMPIPYNYSCGSACHDSSKLQYQGPGQ